MRTIVIPPPRVRPAGTSPPPLPPPPASVLMTMLPLPSIRIPEKNPLVDLTDDAIAGLLDQFDDRRDDQLAEDDVARIISLPIAG